MKSGLTLIELVISLAFSLIIMMLVFNSFFQIASISRYAENRIENDVRISIMSNQLEKDLAGVFVPVQAIMEPMVQPGNTQAPQAGGTKLLQKVFYGANKGENLSVLSFITNNPLRMYQKTGAEKPRIVRVAYRLVEDKNHKGSFALIRQEGTALEFDAYDTKAAKPIVGYQLADGIKKMAVTYKIPAQKNQSASKDSAVDFETLKEWRPEKKEKPPLIPQFVSITLTLWDMNYQKEHSYTIDCIVQAFDTNKSLSFKQTATTGQPGKPSEAPKGPQTGPNNKPGIVPSANPRGPSR